MGSLCFTLVYNCLRYLNRIGGKAVSAWAIDIAGLFQLSFYEVKSGVDHSLAPASAQSSPLKS